MKVVSRSALVVAGLLSAAAIAHADPRHQVGDDNTVHLTTGEIDQTSRNSKAVSNGGVINASGDVGKGASASVSATGALAAVSASSIDVRSGAAVSIGIESISQTATNKHADITNSASVDTTGAGSQYGNLSGKGASVSAAATGAVAAVSFSKIDNLGGSIRVGNITQTATNKDSAISNENASIVVGNLTGKGASVAISATGAMASIAVSSINSGVGSVHLGDITQTAKNQGSNATVTNSGMITLGSLSGAGASASISAVGAGSVISFSAIGGKSNK